jgi:hypothetical protein
MPPLQHLQDRWESSFFDFLMINLDLAFALITSAGTRHGLPRAERLQNADCIHDLVLDLSSNGSLTASHKKEISDRLTFLKTKLNSLGAESLRAVPKLTRI